VNKASSRSVAAAKPAGSFAVAGRYATALGRNCVSNLGRWCGVVARAPVAKTPPWPPAAIPAAILVLGAVVAAMFLVDRAGDEWAQHLPRWFSALFDRISKSGLSGWFLIPFGSIVLCLAALTSPALPRLTRGVLGALAARFGFLFLAIGAPGLFVTIVKRLIGRARPYVDIHGDPFTYRPLIWRPEYASLPSGHATTAAATAIAIGAIWPRTRWIMWLYALLVMFSRVADFAHHPSDVIAGALVGTIGAVLVRRWFAARRLVFSPLDLKALPGPSLARAAAALRRAVRHRPVAETVPIEPRRGAGD
jgi:membrane-associated phospholipid phosphatase